MSLCAPHYEQHFDRVLSVSESRPVAWGTDPLFQHLPALPLNCKWPQNWRHSLMPYRHSSQHVSIKYGWDLHVVCRAHVSLDCIDLFQQKFFFSTATVSSVILVFDWYEGKCELPWYVKFIVNNLWLFNLLLISFVCFMLCSVTESVFRKGQWRHLSN